MNENNDIIIKAIVTGALGAMGRLFIRRIVESPDAELYGAAERHDHPMVGKDVGIEIFGRTIDVSLENDLRNCVVGANVVIDFTLPDATLSHVKTCAELKIPYVCGTTGMTKSQFEIFQEHAQKMPCVWAPNFSLGVTLLTQLAERAASTLGDDFDLEIVETHHRRKVDSPSGTALALAKAAATDGKLTDADVEFGRKGQCGPRQKGQIGIHAVRGGDIIGRHEMHFFGDGEQITLTHQAYSRDAFVRGAMRAAAWLQGREPGLYTMKDVLWM